MSGKTPVRPAQGGLYIEIHAKPRAGKTRLDGIHDGALKVHLAAPPTDGEANGELLRFLAKLLGLPKSSLELVSGAGSRHKRVFARDATAAEAEKALGCPGERE